MILLSAQSLKSALFILLILVAFYGELSLIFILISLLAFLDGCSDPASDALIPRFVQKETLVKANSTAAIVYQTVEFGCWALGGVFLAEETGEVARAIRAMEIGRDRPDEYKGTNDELKQDLTEELGDVLGNIIVIANKYNIALEDIFQAHYEKLQKRYDK